MSASCPQCSTAISADSRFCGVCGYRLDGPPQPVAPKPAEAGPSGATPLVPTNPPPPIGAGVAGGDLFATPTSDPYLGKTLNNRFVVEKKLGEGGFGAVYRGTQSGTNRIVALKLLHPEMTRDSNVVERFRREGQVLCSLKDAHTVTTYDFDQTEDGTLFIAMELLEGRSLHDVFATEAPITWQRMVKILSEMCSSLAEAHAMGIVHRDLKPENVHLEKRPGNDEFVKILDFGIAKVLHGEGGQQNQVQLTATGQTLGTLEYMSPEQLMGKSLDGRSDIYGLGVLAYELLTGRLPFPDAVGPAMLISAQLKKVPEKVSVANPNGGFPPEVDALILKMLEKDRNNRHADVSVLRDECLRILAQQAQPTPSGGNPLPAQAVAPSQVSGPGPMPHTPSQPGWPEGQMPSTKDMLAASSGSKTWLYVALVGLMLAGGALAFFLTK